MKLIKPNWPAPASIHAFTTTRHSYNGGSLKDLKHQNFKTLFNLPTEPIWINQTHSNIAIEAIPSNANQIADASYALQPNHICVVATADCLPILICNDTATKVAAIHAGWRGLARGIIAETIKPLQTNHDNWLVWLGPAISEKHFEVGQEVYDEFVAALPQTNIAFIPKNNHKWLANLYAIARIQLNLLGIKNIYGGEYCTYSQEDLFYSYRRDKGHTGRMASLIWINSH